jgi:hypothetical protein
MIIKWLSFFDEEPFGLVHALHAVGGVGGGGLRDFERLRDFWARKIKISFERGQNPQVYHLKICWLCLAVILCVKILLVPWFFSKLDLPCNSSLWLSSFILVAMVCNLVGPNSITRGNIIFLDKGDNFGQVFYSVQRVRLRVERRSCDGRGGGAKQSPVLRVNYSIKAVKRQVRAARLKHYRWNKYSCLWVITQISR